MTPTLDFRLKLPGTDILSGLNATSTSFQVRGTLRIEGSLLVVEWGGAVRVQEVGPLTVRDEREWLPDERLLVPLLDLEMAEVVGGWWWPRLTVHANTPGALAEIPSAVDDVVKFWYGMRDRAIARALAADINDAISREM